MKRALLVLWVLCFAVLSTSAAFSQKKIDLTGTWTGSTVVEPEGFPLILTLTVKHDGKKITGTLYDDMGYIDSKIQDVVLKSNKFSFEAIAMPPEGEIPLLVNVTVSGDTMKGGWDADIYYGKWIAVRKKSKLKDSGNSSHKKLLEKAYLHRSKSFFRRD